MERTAKKDAASAVTGEFIDEAIGSTASACAAYPSYREPRRAKPDVKRRILLAEDHQEIREVLCLQLQVLGYEVAVAKNGMEAVTMALSEHPDMILMDVLMPKMNGLEAVWQIRDNPEIRQIPVLAVTGWGSSISRIKYLASGFDGYIAKPFTHKELRSAIEKLLRDSVEKSTAGKFLGEKRDGAKSS